MEVMAGVTGVAMCVLGELLTGVNLMRTTNIGVLITQGCGGILGGGVNRSYCVSSSYRWPINHINRAHISGL